MNAKMKATFAVAIVAMMVFAAAGATTYSWFSDSESTDITVTTAKVDIDTIFQYSDDNGVTWDDLKEIDGVTKTFPVVQPGVTYKFKVSYDGKDSSIATAYILKAIITGPVTMNMSEYLTLDGKKLPVLADDQTTEEIVISKSDDIRGWIYYEPGVAEGVIEFDLVADSNWSVQNNGSTFGIELVSELYQASAVSKESVIPENVDEVETQIITDDGDVLGVKVTGLKNIIPNGGYFSVKTVPVDIEDGFKVGTIILDFNLADENGNDIVEFNGNYLTISVDVSAPVSSVKYLGSGLDPEYCGCIANDDGTYTVTFTTKHFSEYALVPAFVKVVAGDEVGYYADLSVAIDKADDRSTVTVLKSHVGSGAVIDKNITVDFCGNEYIFSPLGVGSGDLTSNGFQILKDNTVTLMNGSLAVSEDCSDKFYILIQNYADLSIEGMTLDGTYLDKWSKIDGDSYVLSNNSGTVQVSNSTIIANDDGDKAIAFDVCKYANYEAPIVTIANCEIYGAVEVSKVLSDNLKIESGTFEVGDAGSLACVLRADSKKVNVVLTNDVDLPISSLGQQTGGSGEYKLGGESTESIVIDLNDYKLNITTTYWSAIGAKNDGATITIKNGTMTSSQATGTWNSYDLTFANCNYAIEGVTFDKAIAFTNTGKNVTVKGVVVNETHDYYAVWISARGQTIEIDNLTVNSDGRGIKIDEEYVDAPAKVTLNVENSKFTTIKKAAIMVKSVAGADITVSEVDITNVEADPIHVVWVDEDAKQYDTLVTVTGGLKAVEGTFSLIYSAEDLFKFAEDVNSGNTFSGKTVYLVNDIDLENKSWTPIGLNADNANKFNGIFDGRDKTISNLKVVTDPGYTAAGFFGALGGIAKNFTIDGAIIEHISTGSATDNGIAVVAGSIYPSGSIDNVHVKDAVVKGNRYLGGIAGYVYGSITNCSVEKVILVATPNAVTNGYDNGDKVGGIAGYWSSERSSERVYTISGNTSTSVTITGYRDLGGILGCGNNVSTVTGNVVKNLRITVDQVTNFYGEKDKNANPIVGRVTGDDSFLESAAGTVDGYKLSVAIASEDLNSVITSGNTDISLGKGNYDLPSVSGKVMTFSGTEDVEITIAKPNYTGSSVTFNGVTIKGSGYSTGIQHVNAVTYNGATIVGEMCLYGEKVVFNNCTFKLAAGQYIWTYGAKEVEFNNCTFNTAGKAILIYNEGAGASKVTVKGCTFNATAGATAGAIANQNCAAIEIDNFQKELPGAAHELITEGNTYGNNFSGEWRIKNYQDGGKVTVNDIEYTQTAIDGKLMTVKGGNVTSIEQ